MQARATSSSSPSFAPKLGHRDAVEIRRAHAAGASPGELARSYGIARSSLYAVLRGRAHVCTVTVRLDDEIFLRLEEVADREGLTFEDVVGTFIHRALHMEPLT